MADNSHNLPHFKNPQYAQTNFQIASNLSPPQMNTTFPPTLNLPPQHYQNPQFPQSNFLYQPHAPGVNVASPYGMHPQIPPHSAQMGVPQINLVDEKEIVKPTGARRTGKKDRWTVSEEELLISSWSTVSTDSKVGNDQKSKEYWDKIAAYFNEARAAGTPARNGTQVKNHYYKIMPLVNMFSQWYNNIANNRASGEGDDDVLERALKKWRSEHNEKEFRFLHVWKRSQICEKWGTQAMASNARKKGKFSESDSPSSGDAGARTRPMGQQRAKRMAKGKVKEEDNSIERAENGHRCRRILQDVIR